MPGLDFQLAPTMLSWGWLLVLFLTMRMAWGGFQFLKVRDYFNSIRWTYLQVLLPDTAEETPRAMEEMIAVMAGVYKSPDLVEMYFEGYLDYWYSLEVQCTKDEARYFVVCPEVHRQFVEGVIYGQFPDAEIREVEDYTLRYDYKRVREDFDMYGTDIIPSGDIIYGMRTYTGYDDPVAPEENFVDPHQAIIEAYTNINPGEEFWFQVVVQPKHKTIVEKFVQHGEEEVAKLSGRAKGKRPGILRNLLSFLGAFPRELMQAAFHGPVAGGGANTLEQNIRFHDPIETEKMKWILSKISRELFPTTVRVIYIAPKGQYFKPNIGRAIGAFKQFQAFKPDPFTKSNGVDYFMKDSRRKFRERQILYWYQGRDPKGGPNNGFMMTAEEIATLYHFPSRWIQSPVVTHTKSGTREAPDNVPYV